VIKTLGCCVFRNYLDDGLKVEGKGAWYLRVFFPKIRPIKDTPLPPNKEKGTKPTLIKFEMNE
jgi:hypothetical protein